MTRLGRVLLNHEDRGTEPRHFLTYSSSEKGGFGPANFSQPGRMQRNPEAGETRDWNHNDLEAEPPFFLTFVRQCRIRL